MHTNASRSSRSPEFTMLPFDVGELHLIVLKPNNGS